MTEEVKQEPSLTWEEVVEIIEAEALALEECDGECKPLNFHEDKSGFEEES